MASKSENLAFSAEINETLTDFGAKIDKINSENFDGEKREELIEKEKSELLIKICSVEQDPEKIAALIDELNLGKAINKFDENNVNPLLAYLQSAHLQGENNNLDAKVQAFIDELEKKGLNPNAKSHIDGNTALHMAIQNGLKKEVLQALLNAEQILVNVKNDSGKTPLDLAVEGQNVVIAKMLIKEGAQLGAYVINEGGKPNQDAGQGRQLFEDRASKYNEEVAAKITEEYDRQQKLLEEIRKREEAAKDSQEEAQKLAELKIQIKLHEDVKKFFTEELARIQAQEKWLESLSEMNDDVAADYSPNIDETKEESSLDAEKDNSHVVIFGEEIDLSDKTTINTLLHYYAMRGNMEATMEMIRNGGDLNTNIGGRTVFEAAIESGNSALHNLISSQNPQVINNLKGSYKEVVFGDLLKGVDLNISGPTSSGARDDSDLGKREAKESSVLTSKDDIDLRPSPSPKAIETRQVDFSIPKGTQL